MLVTETQFKAANQVSLFVQKYYRSKKQLWNYIHVESKYLLDNFRMVLKEFELVFDNKEINEIISEFHHRYNLYNQDILRTLRLFSSVHKYFCTLRELDNLCFLVKTLLYFLPNKSVKMILSIEFSKRIKFSSHNFHNGLFKLINDQFCCSDYYVFKVSKSPEEMNQIQMKKKQSSNTSTINTSNNNNNNSNSNHHNNNSRNDEDMEMKNIIREHSIFFTNLNMDSEEKEEGVPNKDETSNSGLLPPILDFGNVHKLKMKEYMKSIMQSYYKFSYVPIFVDITDNSETATIVEQKKRRRFIKVHN